MSTIKVNNIENRTGSSITIGGSSTTSLNLASTITGGTLTMTPAFQASLSANQVISDAVSTKVQFNTELFDTDNCYNNTTNYRFTPTVAGKYFVYTRIRALTGTTYLRSIQTRVYKNGSIADEAKNTYTSNEIGENTLTTTSVIDMNGSTDYIEVLVSVDVITETDADLVGGDRNQCVFGAYRLIGA